MRLYRIFICCVIILSVSPLYSQTASTWHLVDSNRRLVYSPKDGDPLINLQCGDRATVEVWIADPGGSYKSKQLKQVMLTALHGMETRDIRYDKYRSGRDAIVFNVEATSLIWTALLMDRGFSLYNAPSPIRIPGEGATSLVKDFLPICLSPGRSARQNRTNMPDIVSRTLADLHKSCKKRSVQPEFMTTKDVNGDGVIDWILNFEHYSCEGGPNEECGSGGCTVKVFASVGEDFRKVFDSQVHKVEFRTNGRTPQMFVALHGSYCGKVGAEPCQKLMEWNGTSFETKNDRSSKSQDRREVRMSPVRYDIQRKNMLREGYVPITSNKNCNTGREDVCKTYPEAEDCSGTGLGYCNFIWRRGENIIEIVTTGEDVRDLSAVKSVSCGAKRC